jgi:hypothetical protein
MEIATFTCSICGEISRDICVHCTKDACANHLCERCGRCSDCCQCEVALLETQVSRSTGNGHLHAVNGHVKSEALPGDEALPDDEDELVDEKIEGIDEEFESNPE